MGNDRALENARDASVTYSTSIEQAEVIEAYTLKADGKRIDAPKSNYQVKVNRGKDNESPVFSDRTTLTVVFPEVEVGDTVVFSYKLSQTEPMFPGHFSEQEFYPRTEAYDDVRVRIDASASLWTWFEARQLTETENSAKEGRRVVEWTYRNSQPAKSNRTDYSIYDVEKEPGFAISTFKSHAEIAEAYGARARRQW